MPPALQIGVGHPDRAFALWLGPDGGIGVDPSAEPWPDGAEDIAFDPRSRGSLGLFLRRATTAIYTERVVEGVQIDTERVLRSFIDDQKLCAFEIRPTTPCC